MYRFLSPSLCRKLSNFNMAPFRQCMLIMVPYLKQKKLQIDYSEVSILKYSKLQALQDKYIQLCLNVFKK